MIQFICKSENIFKNIWSKKCSLRSQCTNQLERAVVNGGWSNLLGFHGKWLNNQLKWIIGMCHHHNCWVILDERQQGILCVKSCIHSCWAELGIKQKTFTFYCCIVGTCSGGMQKAFIKLEKCQFPNCSCYCGDLSHCCSCSCSCCREGLRSCDVILVIIVCLKSSRCCSCWDANLQNSQCRIVIWDRNLLMMRMVIIWKLQETQCCNCRAVVWK